MQKYICPCLFWAAGILAVVTGVLFVLTVVTSAGVWQ